MTRYYFSRYIVRMPVRRRTRRKTGIALIATALFVLWIGFMFIDKIHL